MIVFLRLKFAKFALNKERKFPTFHRLLNEVFGDQLSDATFLAWLAKKFEIRPSKFRQYVLKWRENEFKEVWGEIKFQLKFKAKFIIHGLRIALSQLMAEMVKI